MDKQQGRAIVLSVLMLALAQTSYIGAMQGWSYPKSELSPEGSPSVAWTSPPPLSYTPNGQNTTLDTTMTTMSPVLTGAGDITSWELSAALPQGVTFNTSTGVISGTPTEVWTNTTYTVWANNSSGSTNTTIWLKVSVLAPNISYNVTNVTLIVNASSVSYVATNSGGNISNGGDGIAGFSDAFCSLTENGTVLCWGQNEHGRINATASTSDSLEPTIVPMPLGRFATGVAVGAEVACALLDNSSVVCWGDSNESRILSHWAGDGIIPPRFISGLGGSASVTQLQVSYDTACVLLSDGDMQCWGLGAWGNLGQGNTTSLALPTSVSILPSTRSVVQIAVGAFHACALLDNNSLMCFGDNDYYQLGDGTTTYRPFGVYADLGTRTISTVSAGWLGTCVAYHEGGASCWGRNDYGMVGDGTATARSTPVNVTGLGANTTFASLHTLFGETCGIATNGSLLCWGNNNGFQAADSYTPGIVDVGTNVSTVSVALDTDTACALLSTGEIQCWGYSGGDENFGLNSTSSSSTPVRGVTNETHRTINGGWNIVGTLPQGLQFSPVNGTIWGTPVVVQPQWTNYTVKVYNSAGSSTYMFSIRVIDALPNVTYAPSNLTLTNNTVSSDLPLVPTLTGAGEISSWAINASLPAGLTFGTNNGTIYGTPTALSYRTAYLIWANNSGGSVLLYLNLTVNDQLPSSVAYTPNTLVLTKNTSSSDLPLVPSVNGPGQITLWALNSSLPNGLYFNNNNGTIWGTPTQVWPTTAYRLSALNSGGTVYGYFNLSVVDEVPVLSYTASDLQLTNNTASSDLPLEATLTGPGEITSWEINASLPAGLNFGTSNGTMWGTPTELWPSWTYTIWANNSGGSTSATVTIIVVDEVPALSYTPAALSLRNNTASPDLPLTATLSGPGEITSWAISDSLPAGVSFGTTNGTFWGTPTELWTSRTYTVWANNSGGSTSATVTIEVVDQVPSVAYVPASVVLVNNTASPSLPLVPSITGPGDVTSWAINASLPNGLSFDAAIGTVTGVATELWPMWTYTVWANNSGGSSSTTITLEVVDRVPGIAYVPASVALTNNTPSSFLPLAPTVTGPGHILTWEISGELPSGVSFDASTGVFSGLATELWTATTYTVWANTTGGAATTTITLSVVDQVPSILYAPSSLSLTNGTSSSLLPLSPSTAGQGEITGWSITPDLPSGLFFGTNNGTLWGTPHEVSPSQRYTVTAFTTGGEATTSLTIVVQARAPSITLMPSTLELVAWLPDARLPLTPTVLDQDGPITWSITPDLPAGLSFSSGNGSVWGLPTEPMLTRQHTIRATGAGGSDEVTLVLTVRDPTPVLRITSEVVLVEGRPMPTWSPTLLAGTVDTWALAPELPDGLTFEASTGGISGTPTTVWERSMWTLWANTTGVSLAVHLNMTVLLDTDGDGRPDGLPNGGVPGLVEDVDDDNDGLSDLLEETLGTNPKVRDSDGDGWEERMEVDCATNPANASSVPSDVDGDGVCDLLEADPDNDGWSSEDEAACMTDPLDPEDVPMDTDGDRICDRFEAASVHYSNLSEEGFGYLVIGQSYRFEPVLENINPVLWSSNGSLPTGLELNASTGLIQGIPSVVQSGANITLRGLDLEQERVVEVTVVLLVGQDTDLDGIPDDDLDGSTNPLVGDDDDDNDGAPDDLEQACGSDPRNATSMPASEARLEDGVCVVASGSEEVLPEPGPSPFTLFLLFWVGVAVLFLAHRSREDKDERAARAAQKDKEIEAMIKAAQDDEAATDR